MTITDSSLGSIPLLRLEGRLVSKTAPDLQRALEELWRRDEYRAVLDCTHLDYVSSAGLQVLLIAGKIVEAHGGRIAFAALGPFLGEVFAMTEFSRLFPVYLTPEEAAASY